MIKVMYADTTEIFSAKRLKLFKSKGFKITIKVKGIEPIVIPKGNFGGIYKLVDGRWVELYELNWNED